MAELVLALGTSHGPMLSTPPQDWDLRVQADRAEPAHPFRGAHYSFEQLVALRAAENLAAQTTLAERSARALRCTQALDALRRAMRTVQPDVLLIVGNDQREIFGPALTPALWMFAGVSVFDEPVSRERLASMPPAIAISSQAIKPKTRVEYPVHQALAQHLARSLTRSGFDMALSAHVPQRNPDHPSGMPHAFSFIYQRLLQGQMPPHVPLMLNTFYPPNQPGAARCVDLGVALYDALRSWPDAANVALIASGGLSHFVIDEAFDTRLLHAMQHGDMGGLRSLDEALLQSGTSEVKNWLPVAAAAHAAGLTMQVLDYVPCYRSEAGTGNAMGFAVWQPGANHALPAR